MQLRDDGQAGPQVASYARFRRFAAYADMTRVRRRFCQPPAA